MIHMPQERCVSNVSSIIYKGHWINFKTQILRRKISHGEVSQIKVELMSGIDAWREIYPMRKLILMA